MITLERFWDKVHKTNDCWHWIASCSHNKYPFFRWDGKTKYAHVVLWESLHGKKPVGFEVDHLCRNTICVRPDHLELVTKRENRRRQTIANRPTHCPQGHSYANPRNRRKGEHLQCAECHRIKERSRRKCST